MGARLSIICQDCGASFIPISRQEIETQTCKPCLDELKKMSMMGTIKSDEMKGGFKENGTK